MAARGPHGANTPARPEASVRPSAWAGLAASVITVLFSMLAFLSFSWLR